jgi:hypothetical protein
MDFSFADSVLTEQFIEFGGGDYFRRIWYYIDLTLELYMNNELERIRKEEMIA